jgi:hypothetical protein
MISCTGAACITACKTLDSTINPLNSTINPLNSTISPQTNPGSSINSTEPCVIIVKNVNQQPHCEGNPKGTISVEMTRGLCMRAVKCPRKGKRTRGCSCCTQSKYITEKCKNNECSNCATASASLSYGKFFLLFGLA